MAILTLPLSADQDKVVRYADFGAKGDGKTNDFEAILKAHQYANENNMPVQAEEDATYFIGEGTEAIPIMTDTRWGKAKFTIDDRIIEVYKYPLFQVCSRLAPFPVEGLKPIRRGQTSIGMELPGRAVLMIYDDEVRRFIRYGGNANDGSIQVDTILVDKKGKIDPVTPVNWDFSRISDVKVRPVDETPLYITGGRFTTYTNAREGRHQYYARNLNIVRSNTILEGLSHKVVEPGGLDSWPYSGFISVSECAEVTVKNCKVSGRKVYGWPLPGQETRKTSGTYDISCARALKVKFINVTQINDIMDTALWGVMGTNFCKSLLLEKCRISRFDAHQGVTNAIIRDCELGHMGINAIGFGTFLIENTVNHCSNFVNFRADYGAVWNGKFVIRNCTFEPLAPKRRANVFGGVATPSHDFGYPCMMPEKITIEDLTIDLRKLAPNTDCAMFANFDPKNENLTAPYPYQVTKQLNVKGIEMRGGNKWIFSRNPKLFEKLKVTGQCPGYRQPKKGK